MNAAKVVTSVANRQYLANLVATFAAFGRRCSLWPKATTFQRSQSLSLRPLAVIVCCGPSLIAVSGLPQFRASAVP